MRLFSYPHRNLAVILSIFLLTGCFGGNGGTTVENAETFAFNGATYSLQLPGTWQKLTPPEQNTDILLLAQNNNENLVILRGSSDTPEFAQAIWEGAKQDMFWFEAGTFSPTQWNYRAKREVGNPVRAFFQKAFPIPQSQNFLLASCSYEPDRVPQSSCQAILNSWRMSTEEPKEQQ